MRRIPQTICTAAVVGLLAGLPCRAAEPIFDAERPNVAGRATVLQYPRGVRSDVERDGRKWLRLPVTSGDDQAVRMYIGESAASLSVAEGLRLTLKNAGQSPATVRVVVSNDGVRGLMNACRNAVELMPGESRVLSMRLTRRPQDPGYAVFAPYYMYFKGMNVRDNTVDPSTVSIVDFTVEAAADAEVLLASIEPYGRGNAKSPPFLPFIDGYGQYVHGDWPGKIYEDADFGRRVEEERREQNDFPKPADWDQYGGWAKGPRLKATGFFYPAKHDGKWWLVDPEGCLYWSYGPTGVGFGGDVTPVTGRQNWFVSLPDENGPLGQFYKDGRRAMYKYYADKPWRGFDIQRANLFRKYGPDYEKKVAEISHTRLHSWGFNTLGCWSSDKVYALKKTPYTVAINSPSVSMMRGGDGHYLQDVFDAKWGPGLYAEIEKQRDKTAGDPWCIGYFVDNERAIGGRPRGAAIGETVLRAPANQPAKAKFIGTLRAKYPTIDALNKAWKTGHASWDALRDSTTPPMIRGNADVEADCGDFGTAFLTRYWSVSRDAVKAVAPNNLFLGTRFYGHVDGSVFELAAQYWDVISYNIYDMPPNGRVNQFAKFDKPILSTEWGVESDVFQTPFRDEKLTAVPPAERAAKMADYTERMLRLPNVVGCHFFQYRDQPLSGRPDGEATLRGFVNVADTPSMELVAANRRVAYRMYETRAKTK